MSKLIVTPNKKELVSVIVDPAWETADVNFENNHYPRRIIPSRISSYKDEEEKKFEHRDTMFDIKSEKEEPKPKPFKK